jgi:hypothetical protein
MDYEMPVDEFDSAIVVVDVGFAVVAVSVAVAAVVE